MHGCGLAVKSLHAVLTGREGELPNRLCPLCHREATAVAPDGDLLVCLDGTVDVVCRSCALEHDPELATWLLSCGVTDRAA